MIEEGKGLIAPSRIRISLSKSDVELLVQEAIKRNKYRQYSSRKDQWGKGMICGGILGLTTMDVPASARPILIGLGGEWAAIEAIRKRCNVAKGLDLKLLEQGDGGKDIEVNGLRIDVKCRSQQNNQNRVRLFWSDGNQVKNPADAYVFAEWIYQTHIDVIGWATLTDLKQWEIEKRGHVNAIAGDEYLKPLNSLVSLIKSKI